MLKRQIGTLFLAICLTLTTVPSVLGENTQTITVTGDGSGDYNVMEWTTTSRLTRR